MEGGTVAAHHGGALGLVTLPKRRMSGGRRLDAEQWTRVRAPLDPRCPLPVHSLASGSKRPPRPGLVRLPENP